MEKEVSVSTSQGIGLPSVLTIVFVVLKLTGVITWSWWWVLSPLLIAGGIGIIALVLLLIIAATSTR